jgi:hypothetical protein
LNRFFSIQCLFPIVPVEAFDVYGERKRNFVGQHFWARGYFVSTVGRDETMIREYIRNQEKADEQLEQINFGNEWPPSRWPKRIGAALATLASRFERLTN